LLGNRIRAHQHIGIGQVFDFERTSSLLPLVRILTDISEAQDFNMAYNDPYAGPPPGIQPQSYQIDSSIMRPANLPPLSYQTGGGGFPDNSNGGGYRGGPDRNAPRRGGYRSAGPPGRGGRSRGGGGGNGYPMGREYEDRNSHFQHQGNGQGYGGGGYENESFGGGPANPYAIRQGFAPSGSSRNEFDGEHFFSFSSCSSPHRRKGACEDGGEGACERRRIQMLVRAFSAENVTERRSSISELNRNGIEWNHIQKQRNMRNKT
jgi:hypothetical protein